jgi:hypothetical protein
LHKPPRGVFHRRSRSERGQGLVEFALVLPLVMILLLGVADFGRIFSAGITLEAAARDAAEATAIERLHNPPDPLTPGDIAYYQRLHVLAAKTVCDEASRLPNSTPQLASNPSDPPASPITPGECPDFTTMSGVFHPGSPVIRVCVHDGADPLCGQPIPGYSPTIPANCPKVQALAANPSNASAGEPVSYLVEVRLCYLFTTLFDLHLNLPMNAGLNLGNIWLERSRAFVVDCPQAVLSAC